MDFDTGQPIYRQIIDDFKKKLVRGELQAGDKIPSQREYAENYRVNPNTVQRAYREMESMNIVETVRGQGTFIRIDQENLTRIRGDMATQVLEYYVNEMKALGYEGKEIIELVSNHMSKEEVYINDTVSGSK
ncbi:MAG: GntR family transcriptional regulator [Chitinophagales bacterium]